MTKLLEEAIKKVKQLPESEQERIAQVMLKELENLNHYSGAISSKNLQLMNQTREKQPLPDSQLKLSEVLLLPELEDDEVLCERNNDTGRDIIL